ncbi:hypothetical protein GGS23DRAFT_291025 [Durotheca rogersii]|uniref:uncharacterized protein n=1 Tax=Durotheca rogersii TaxID=419775 RepID=UPI00222013A3|nr:uncharacterized protein GGS23DRAFT_291025 [Durotheca rogersii]KAI5866825.1 hypothetical protein GGS23DRAFT_291025 [Durotheca rogersii]
MPKKPFQCVPRNCESCRKNHVKCIYRQNSDACDRCVARGQHCEPPLTGVSAAAADLRRETTRFKCDQCRTGHLTCHPKGRTWPDKCLRCAAKGLACSPPHTKKEFDESPAGKHRVRRRRHPIQPRTKNQFQHTEGLLMPITSDLQPSDSSSDSDASIPAVIPPKREPVDGGGPKSSEIERLSHMLQEMDDEFQEVLRAEKEKHRDEVKQLKDKYEEELAQQREKYESRIDDLIKIMKKIG